jgi:hypothetical protein
MHDPTTGNLIGQGILISSVEMQKILHWRLLDAKHFDRACQNADQGCRNPKDFAFATYTPKIFSILCAWVC